MPPVTRMTRERLMGILGRLDTLVGLEDVKATIRQIFAHVYIQEQRRMARLKTAPTVLHMVFSGNPGTGKTTVARLLAEMYRDLGLLEKGHLVEVERADLVGEYIGHTAQKTREHIERALGGVLFIDEAYSLARGGNKDFGREAIDCLVKGMEDHRNQFVAIIAGYEAEMQAFLATNPGLPSRFPLQLTFPDYTLSSLIAIAKRTAALHQYKLSADAEFALRRVLQRALANPSRREHFSNARFVRNLMEKAIRAQSSRLFEQLNPSREELMTLRPEDFREGSFL
jgi:stage V sporulation protein K